MHSAFAGHIKPLDEGLLNQLQSRRVLLYEEELCNCGRMIICNEWTKALKCKHVMHIKCFDRWVKQNKNCYRCDRAIEPLPVINELSH